MVLALTAATVGAPVAGEWPLPVPIQAMFAPPEHLSGVLIKIGHQTYQARDFGMLKTADGRLAVGWLQGYDSTGASVRMERQIAGSVVVGFTHVFAASDDSGFLVVKLAGTEAPLLTPSHPCGIFRLYSCESRSCGAGCGDAPACICSTPGKGCDQWNLTSCTGECTEPGYRCSTLVEDCGCVLAGGGSDPIEPPPGNPDQPGPGQPVPKSLQLKDLDSGRQ
jgi:hypothetical protein